MSPGSRRSRGAPRRLTREEARRLAVLGQLLAGERPAGVVDTVDRLGRIQVDPTSIVERAERLTLWSRLGSYDRDELRRSLEEPPRELFEYVGFLMPVGDLPLHRHAMHRYPPTTTARGGYVAEWLRDNAAFRGFVLDELRARGPLRSRDIDDRAEVPWQTGGWNDGKNVSRMLEILWRAGEIAITRREGSQRVWDLFERVFPGEPEPLPEEIVAIELMDRQLRARGVVEPGWGTTLSERLPAREIGEESLRADGIAVPVAIDGIDGEWLTHVELLAQLDEGTWHPRTTLLSGFDPLIADRERTASLFGFRYKIEIYIPVAKREFGYYVMPILDGDRLIGRVDPAFDRKEKILRLNAIGTEPDVPQDAADRVGAALRDLAEWLGAMSLVLPDDLPRSLRGLRRYAG